ncbi:MAG: hypothetical protein ACLVJI_02650 [Bacilli bacterium]
MKKQHFAILAAAALITAAMAPASAQPGKHNVRSTLVYRKTKNLHYLCTRI